MKVKVLVKHETIQVKPKNRLISRLTYLKRPSATRTSYIVVSGGLMRDLIRCRAPLLPSLLPRTIQAFSMQTAYN